MDRWILSKLNSTVGAVDDNLANYRIPEAAKALVEAGADRIGAGNGVVLL